MKLLPPTALNNDQFGYSVSISRDKIVVGQPFAGFDNQSRYGTSWAFVRNLGGVDNWGLVQKLDRSDPGNNDQFGIAVAIGQDTVVIGVNMDDEMSFMLQVERTFSASSKLIATVDSMLQELLAAVR